MVIRDIHSSHRDADLTGPLNPKPNALWFFDKTEKQKQKKKLQTTWTEREKSAPAGAPPPPPVYAAAPLAPAPFVSYPQAPIAPPPAQFLPQQPLVGDIFSQQLPVQSGYVAAGAGNFQTGSIQTGQVQGGGSYLAEPVHQVQPLPLLGQPVAYERTVVVAPAQQQLNTAQVLTRVMPASAVLDAHVVEPAVASPNNIVTSINTQTSYGDEQQSQVFHGKPAPSFASSSSSASASAEHHASHQVRVPSASSSVEANERVVPDVIQTIIDNFESTPYPQQVALQTAAPFVPQPAPQHYVAPQVLPTIHQTVVDVVRPVPTVRPIQTIQPIQPAPIQQVPLQPAYQVSAGVATQAPANYAPESKVVAVEDRIEAAGGSDYDQPTNIANNEQATVNELLASLDTINPTTSSNLDFNQVTVEPHHLNQQSATIQNEGEDYDAPLNEDRKDVPTAEPSRNAVPSAPQPVVSVPEETAPIIPQPIQPIQQVQTYHPTVVTSAPAVLQSTVGYVQPEPVRSPVHLQPVAPAVRVELTTVVVATEATPTPAFELPIEVHELVTPQVALQPEPAVIQTITEQPIAEVTVEVLPSSSSAAPASHFFENITSKEDKKEEPAVVSQTEPVSASVAPSQLVNGNDYDEKSVESKVSTETDVVPNLGEYGSKFAKVQGAGTKQVREPIEIETIENANPYERKYWIF
uniref:Uncharacterized protein n=1 Tax=Caenorhabditis japonica TaxID=281687 RepID=A0A8R1HLW4_CAEJA